MGGGDKEMKKRLLPLGFVPAGSTVLIRELDGGRNLSHRLTEMGGLVCGTAIRVIKKRCGRSADYLCG